MTNLNDHEKLMFIPTIVEKFRRGEINHDEMWRQINQEIVCHKYANICVSSDACVCHSTRCI